MASHRQTEAKRPRRTEPRRKAAVPSPPPSSPSRSPRIALPAERHPLIERVAREMPAETLIAPPSERHREVLQAALVLIGERGYAGASLRELARRLGISQPSLYHYVATKEELVEQIITHLGPSLLAGPPAAPPPTKLAALPRYLVELIFGVYANPAYPPFVRFLFVVSTERPQFRAAIQGLYGRGFEVGARVLMEPFVTAGELTEAEARALVRTAINGIGLLLIEEFVLGARRTPTADARAYGDELVRLLEDALKHRAGRRTRAAR